jgi:hypothetical protein
MIIPILLLAISLLIITVISLRASKNSQEIDYREIVIGVALVLIGFSLAMIYDNIKEINIEKKERKSLVTMLQFELANMHATITNNLKIAESNLELLQSGEQNIKPLELIETAAWESAKLRNHIFVKNTGDLFKLANLYSAIHLVNEKIRFRENYRVANQSTVNYTEILRKIDTDIKSALEKTKKFHKLAQDFLYKEYPLIVKGYSFSLDRGEVKKVEKDKNNKRK